MKRAITSTSITITDPLVKYHSLLATELYSPDPAQHRLAIHLQKIYFRLKDYSPSIEYRARLKAISDTLESTKSRKCDDSAALAIKSHPIWRNPLFTRFFATTEAKDTLAMTRVLTGHEAAIQINSPQGLFLSGEVGTGKSMLLDLLANGLPTSRKRRWHFSTFMLHTLSQLEHYRKTHTQLGSDDQQYSLLWMAKEMVEKSPILFLDEFQLPDRAASKILSNLFTAFFQLGGVLVASSNRMPEELEKASGFDYAPAPNMGGLIGQMLGISKKKGKGELFGPSSDFANFLEVLKARCEFWQMEGGKDWRRREADGPRKSGSKKTGTSLALDATAEALHGPPEAGDALAVDSDVQTPRNYFLTGVTEDRSWITKVESLATFTERSVPWTSSTLTVYGRTFIVLKQHNGVVCWDFGDLVSSYGPADYITMASTFHTFIIDKIPVLTVLKKNEARRLITLLDALYEARCKLIVRAEVGPDDLFFPETKVVVNPAHGQITGQQGQDRVDSDAILPETIAEVYQDQTSPFRPNISTYTGPANAAYDPDQDSDFGLKQNSRLDFSNASVFTGEDERFAYKRATSRLWELCGAQWHARTGDWWQPLLPDARHWERGPSSQPVPNRLGEGVKSDAFMGPSVELDELAGLQRLRVEQLRKSVLGEMQHQGKSEAMSEGAMGGNR
ncbi:AFG1-like ATPase-domain-containing protein [Pseudomassariella vexata]|uniref:AFG1-like ATPase-domain-containing protein n=1 Tax=Pseudomassariella vexata TaxID=1141098 RepID=A0A1Y2DK30_9PEZI|nr:AFG1-like ATPase-domain-containing protein [Pseudomassariella vexata]ORY59618.1 AFG1-like ATPase-domain-containing protein [Pseudomassariella vexata]